MSQTAVPPPPVLPSKTLSSGSSGRHSPARWTRRILVLIGVCLAVGLALVLGERVYRTIRVGRASEVPTAKVQRGDLELTITALGELRGQNPEILTAPMTGGNELHLTSLLKPGTPVKEGDVVARFDTTEQEYKLKEAEADLAEAGQHILQAKAQQGAQDEEDRYALSKAKTDVVLAEIDTRKNPLLAPIVARQNDLALSSARDHLAQLQQNLANRKATNAAAIEIQAAGREKAEAQATAARQNIEAMTLRTNRSGYVSVERNTNVNFMYDGMTLPLFQVGDAVRPGMEVVEIPDLNHWEIEANIGELDRGHIAVGDQVEVVIIAAPDKKFTGRIKEVGGTSGPPWNRRFPCKLTIDHTSPELRPGMTAKLIITTDRLRNVLWLPAQALFENDGRTFVYARSGSAFSPKDVKLVRRNETRVVISGLAQGQVVALANPLETGKKQTSDKNSALHNVGR
ncbi:MAG: HlyD family efflux transporter periplasmic adaptor subunit [Acidobacteriota bacterium]|nr:HlyD family efflux transporter periplasmic adaptor subunit [Acidobacteriota bacterium]